MACREAGQARSGQRAQNRADCGKIGTYLAIERGVPMKTAIPKPRLTETYEVQCFACNQTVEIAVDVMMDGWCICPTPGCGKALLIRWSALTRVPA